MRDQNTQTKTASGINVIAGLWLMLSAYFMNLGFSSNEFITGILIAIVSLVGLYSIEQASWVSWVAGIMGAWLLVTPIFVTGLSTAVIWNSVIVGIIVLAMSIWSGMSSSSTMGHGHPKMG